VLASTAARGRCVAELRLHLTAARSALKSAGLDAARREDLEALASEVTRQ
jgi:hypothetical protein